MIVQERREAGGILLALENVGLEWKGNLEPEKYTDVLETDVLRLRSQKEKGK